ncbi:UvrD-helicase domain-containing protein [Paraburkholderia madseniana]|uniref:UvrD-helicase domain-containing protein n=1 Tax=Paraburkholderia madseniana TaxID=2599607 RepID=UPI0015C53F93|nr:UvrD-helicase domain-containing protein [Paraburkholderia madseniana]NPT64583.1 UvrD-helicase domain-containing protein [Paraburkholderia madseniana]
MAKVRKNRIIVAAAGSGKTTLLVNEALSRPSSRIVIVTYTEANEAEIEKKFLEKNGCVPSNVTLSGWFAFLLQHGVRPYQGCVTETRIEGLNFNQGNSAQYTKGADLAHYLNKHHQIYRDKVSKFALKCDGLSGGRVIKRIVGVFDEIFIDEVQDVAGYDLDLIERLMDSAASVLLVGDPRQGTYSTNDSPKYSKFKKSGIVDYFRQLAAARTDVLIDEISLSVNHRCNVALCEISDGLFPAFSRVTSSNTRATGHDGVFLVRERDVEAYLRVFNPMQLRYWRRTPVSDSAAVMNFGESKGLTFERVLIYPTKDLVGWLKNRATGLKPDVRAKCYVALTRAQSSAGIVIGDKVDIPAMTVWSR